MRLVHTLPGAFETITVNLCRIQMNNNDLPAAEAVYHHVCMCNFYTGHRISGRQIPGTVDCSARCDPKQVNFDRTCGVSGW